MPAVVISSGGAADQATAVATIDATGTVTSVTITRASVSGYTSTPTVTVGSTSVTPVMTSGTCQDKILTAQCIYAEGQRTEYMGDPSCTSGVGLRVSAGTAASVSPSPGKCIGTPAGCASKATATACVALAGCSWSSQQGITTPGFVVQFPGVYKLNYTVFDGCHAPSTKKVTVNAMCGPSSPSPALANTDVSANFDCKNPLGTKGFNGGFTAVSLSGQQTPAAGLSDPGSQFTGANGAGAVNSVGGSWTLAASTGSGWGQPHCLIPQVATNPVSASCNSWRTSQDEGRSTSGANAGACTGANCNTAKQALPTGYNTEQCCQCLYGSVGGTGTVVVSAGATSTSSSGGRTTAATPSQRGGLEAVTESESSNLNLLLGLIIPLGLLLVFSVAVNIYMLNESRDKGGSKGPALQADSTGRDVELSIAPTRV